MQHQQYQHATSYLPVPYEERKSGFLFFKKEDLPLEPDVELFFNSAAARKHMLPYEADGYGLVAVQPLLKAVVFQNKAHGPSPYGFAYPLTAGFVFFWKRLVGSSE